MNEKYFRRGSCRMMRKWLIGLSFIIYHLSFSVACYNRGPLTPDAWNLTEQQIDSISFYTTHHYTQNYNFVVTGDSLVVVAQEPDAMSIPDVVSALNSQYESNRNSQFPILNSPSTQSP